jgi:hypothetical protein
VREEQGQAAVEWVGLVLVAAVALAGLGALSGGVDGRSYGGFLAHRIVCAVRGGCDDGDSQLARTYGERDAELVRRYAPGLVYEPGEAQLPVDYRRCRERRCADAPDDRDLDAHRSRSGERATVFVRVVHRRGRTYIQYWLYYPDSNTAWAGSDRVWERSRLLPLVGRLVRGSWDYPGFHLDDWEGHAVRVDPDGSVYVRSTAHGHWQGCKQRPCRNRWVGRTGWTRVSRGSHAGHIPIERKWIGPRLGPRVGARRRHRRSKWRPLYPGRDLHERTSTADGLRLIPLESLDPGDYRPQDHEVIPPWWKEAYRDPESGES